MHDGKQRVFNQNSLKNPFSSDQNRERSDSVVECLTRDRGAAGSSLIGVTVLCP